MNRRVGTNVDALRAEELPPASPGPRARILFVHSNFAGLRTYARQLEACTAGRDDVDAVHVHLRWPLWAKVLTKAVPLARDWDAHVWRKMAVMRRIVTGWLRGPLHASRFDVVHFMTQSIGLSAIDVAPIAPTRVVLNMDGTGELEVRDFGKPKLAHRHYIAGEKRMFARADLCTGWSRWVVDSLRAHYGVPEERTLVAPPGLDFSRGWAQAEHGARARARLAFVGNAWARKGGARLVEWHQRHWKGRGELHLFSTGAPALDLPNVWVYPGVAYEELIGTHLPAMDMLVVPTHEDTFLLAALEASAVGLPVVSTRLAGVREVVRDGETGILCDRDDEEAYVRAVGELLDQPELRARLGAAGREHARRHYDARTTVGGLVDRLVQLAREGARGGERA